MEDSKWLLKRCGPPILLILFLVITGVFCLGKSPADKEEAADEAEITEMNTK